MNGGRDEELSESECRLLRRLDGLLRDHRLEGKRDMHGTEVLFILNGIYRKIICLNICCPISEDGAEFSFQFHGV